MIDRETIIKLAQEAGFECMDGFHDENDVVGGNYGSITKFAQLVAEHERAKLAQLIERQRVMVLRPTEPCAEDRAKAINDTLYDIVRMIRSRK
jgi:hypothetical protein